MKRPSPLVISLPFIGLTAFALAQSQPSNPKHDAPPKPAPAAVPIDEHTKAMMAAAAPGPIHAKLATLVGDWDEETTIEMPGAPEPMKTKGTVRISSELGGRFVHESGSGEAMGAQSQSAKIWGYNKGSKKFEGAWAWTNGTGLLFLSGESKDDARSIEWNAWYDDIDAKRQEFKVRHDFTDNDHFSVRIESGKMADGTPSPTMITTFTRKK